MTPRLEFVQRAWNERIVPALTEYVTIPCKSPAFDADWKAHGHIDRAVALVQRWATSRKLEGLRLEVVRLGDRTPLLYMEVPGAGDDVVLLYGHIDKQPEMVGWESGLGPWTPVVRGDKLYGRGAADDGYAAFCALTAIESLQAHGIPHARCVLLIEACEESGSPDLPTYVAALAGRIGLPSLVICLDSGCGSYDALWATTSLRGLAGGTLTVDVLREGVHSGAASGIVPSSFRILRTLLTRLEDEGTGHIIPNAFHVDIPTERVEQARAVAAALGEAVWREFPFLPGMRPVASDPTELLLNNTWRPALAITAAAGLPKIGDGGNVLRPSTSLKISLRLPPLVNGAVATRRLKELFESDPPYGVRVTFTAEAAASGWNAPPMGAWLESSVNEASKTYFGQPAMYEGTGGTIPFMAMLGERFPDAQFLVTGVLGPGSNAHGPNEFLHVPTAVKLTASVAHVLADHGRMVAA